MCVLQLFSQALLQQLIMDLIKHQPVFANSRLIDSELAGARQSKQHFTSLKNPENQQELTSLLFFLKWGTIK